jgi:hypothetical protein
MRKLVDDYSVPDTMFVGKAEAGTLTSEAKWQIFMVVETQGLVKRFVDGDSSYSFVFDNRLSYSYL